MLGGPTNKNTVIILSYVSFLYCPLMLHLCFIIESNLSMDDEVMEQDMKIIIMLLIIIKAMIEEYNV